MKRIFVLITAFVFTLVLANNSFAFVWQISPAGNTIAFGNTVVVGVNEIGSSGTQPIGIYGAGFTMDSDSGGAYFDADLWTWDSSQYDQFFVNVNTTDFAWNTGLGQGITWTWGGASEGGLENYFSLGNPDRLVLNSGLATYYVTVGLMTTADSSYPSWGSFHVNPIPEPATMLLLGPALIGLAAIRLRKRG